MAITKQELSELIRDIKSGGDAPLEGKYHPTIIWKCADMVIGRLIEESMYKTLEGNNYDINGDFITTFKNVEVKEDEDTNEKYSVLPAKIIVLKDNRGIHRVSEMKSIDNAFTQVPNGSHDVFSILDAHYLNTKTEFYLEGNKIFYRNLRPAVDKVLIKMVAGISDIDEDAPIPIPASMEDEFLSRVLLILDDQRISPQDKSNDNNPNIPR